MSTKTMKSGPEKIQDICNILRKETLEPAKLEAEKIITDAKAHAERIIKESEIHADKLINDAKKEIERERNILQSALIQAGQQSLEVLRQSIETKLFNPELHKLIQEKTTNPEVISELISAMIKALEKEGLHTDISAIIPQSVPAETVNNLLTENILKKLHSHSVEIGEFKGGAKICLHNKHITLDISNSEIEELLKKYLRKDFRNRFFV